MNNGSWMGASQPFSRPHRSSRSSRRCKIDENRRWIVTCCLFARTLRDQALTCTCLRTFCRFWAACTAVHGWSAVQAVPGGQGGCRTPGQERADRMVVVVVMVVCCGVMVCCGNGGVLWQWWCAVAMVVCCGNGGVLWWHWGAVAMAVCCGGEMLVCCGDVDVLW